MPTTITQALLTRSSLDTDVHHFKCHRKAPRVPVEILAEVIAIFLANLKHRDFRELSSVSLANFSLRQIVLQTYFSTFRPRSHRQWASCCHIPGFFTWVRVLEGFTTILGSGAPFLAHFTNLQTLELDFSDDGLATQSQRAELFAQFLPATLTVIRLVCLPRIDAHILGLIAACCPALETLDVTTLERLDLSCCWTCLEESSTCMVHSPIPDMYRDVEELSVTFATALRPLKQLHHLYLGVCLSDSDVFDAHIDHSWTLGAVSTMLPPFTADQCVLCAEEGYAVQTKDRELMASAVMGRMLPSLQTISWASWFAQSEPGDDPVNRLTTMWIRRTNGVVEVRRAPW